MSRFTRQYNAFLKRIHKLEEKQGDEYDAAMLHYIQTKEMPKDPKLKAQFEFEQRSIQAMVATLPFANKQECRRERTRIFGAGHCMKCEWKTNCFDDDGDFMNEEIED